MVGVGASSPAIVVAGGIPASFERTGVVAVPLVLLSAAAAVGVMLVGYVAVARRIRHSAPFYAVWAAVGRPMAVAAGAVGLLVYLCIGASVAALAGAALADRFGGPWAFWAAATLLVVAVLGGWAPALNIRVLAVVQVSAIVVLAVIVVAALADPAEGRLSAAPFDPGNVPWGGLGLVVALCIAALVGVEITAAFGEEARTDATVGRATVGVVGFAGPFYALSAYALATAVGPSAIAAGAVSGLPFGFLEQRWWPLGATLAALAGLLLIASIAASMLAFHHVFARYVYALARDGVLPSRWARVSAGRREGAPVGGSVLNTVLAGGTLAVFAVFGMDPVGVMFTWLSSVAAIGLLVLLTGTNAAALAYFYRRRHRVSVWVRVVFPLAGLLLGAGMLAATIGNLSALLGTSGGGPVTWLVPGLSGAAAVVGFGRAWRMRRTNPVAYGRVGDPPDPFAVPDRFLSDLRVR